MAALLLGAAVDAVPLVPQKFGRPPVASPTDAGMKYGRPPVASPTDAGMKYVHGKRFDENGNEINLNLSPHQFETRRLTENNLEGYTEFEAAVSPEVNAIAWDGVEGHTTYQLSLNLPEHSDAENVYSIHGTENHPLTLPPAYQVAPPFGSLFGGVNPKLIEFNPESEFDSWLTLGITTGPASFTGVSLSMIGLGLDSWSATQGLVCDDCAMFYMDPSMGPTLEDRDGPSGPRADRGEIVVAQLTVPSEGSYTVTMNAQGKTKGWQFKDALQTSNWSEEDITFTFGDALQSGTHTEPPPPPPTSDIEYESAAVTSHVLTVSTDAIEGHSTFRLALRLQGDARNVYTIYGQPDHPMTMPPAFQTPQPFGVDIGGLSPIIYTQDVPGAALGEFDSWLTVGETEGSTSELANVGIQWSSWTDENPLDVTDGAVFWMQPDHGPSNQDRDGAQGPADSGGDIVVAQLTVPNDHTFAAVINAQGDRMTKSDGSWNEMDIEFIFGHTTASVGPCTMQAAIAHPYMPQCNADGGFLALQCWQKDHCFCVDETGRPLPRDRVPVHAPGGSFYTEAACLAARDALSPVASEQPSTPTQGDISDQVTVSHGQVSEQITVNLEWMSAEERDALADSNSAGYAAAVQRLRAYLARMLNVPESEVQVEQIIAQLDGVDETRVPSAGSTLAEHISHPAESRRSCLRTPDTTYQECSNAGTCTDTQEHIADSQAGESHCDCGVSNWGGPFCEEWDSVDNCQQTTCSNGFQCVDLFGHAICAPNPASQPPPVCEGRCQNGGVCNGVGEMARCDCPANYDGVYCTEHDAVDQCASSPCLNNGSCHDLFGEFFCVCDADHTGRHCEMTVEEDRNDCEPGGSVQCENGGTCIDLFQSFSCICRTGFHGPNCHERSVAETPSPAPEVIVVHPEHNTGTANGLSKHSQNNEATHHSGGRRGFMLVMFFLVAGFAAVGVVAYRQRTDVLSRASFGDDLGKTRLQSKHGSVYENTLYGHMGASVSDGSQAHNAARTGLQPACMLDKAKALASKAGANGVRSAGTSTGRSIYDVGTSDGL